MSREREVVIVDDSVCITSGDLSSPADFEVSCPDKLTALAEWLIFWAGALREQK